MGSVLMSPSRTVGLCLPWLAFPHRSGCLLPPFSVGGLSMAPSKHLGQWQGWGCGPDLEEGKQLWVLMSWQVALGGLRSTHEMFGG